MNDTSEQQVGYSVGSGRGAGAGLAAIEPSHIHIPRRRRVGPPAAAGTGTTPTAWTGDDLTTVRIPSAPRKRCRTRRAGA
jgi:hypothetical protein